MNSTENTGAVGRLYAAIAPAVIERAVQQGVEAGVKAGLEQIEAQRQKAKKDRYDRRLYNTRLLLKNYRWFKEHVAEGISTGAQAKESVSGILDEFENIDYNDTMRIESIRKSQQRTAIIIRHIDRMLECYRAICEQSDSPEDLRRFNILKATYIDEPKKSVNEISVTFGVDRRTVYRDINIAIKPITALIFGIDGIKMD